MDQQIYANASVIGAGLIALVLLLRNRTRSQPSSADRRSEGESTGPSKHIEKLKEQLGEMKATIEAVQKQLKVSGSLDLAAVDQLADDTEEQLRLAHDRDGRIQDLRQSERNGTLQRTHWKRCRRRLLTLPRNGKSTRGYSDCPPPSCPLPLIWFSKR
jgi:hypothetical protein